MTIQIERARTFVEANGTAIDRARLQALLERHALTSVPEPLAVLQQADGGFPSELVAGRPSSLITTATVLRWLHDLRQSESELASRAIQFIESRQTPRGIWRENPVLQSYDPQPWMDPDSPAADVYITALCAGTLVVLSNDELAADQAVSWLQTQQGRDGLLIGFKAHSSWLALPAFAQILGQETRATRRLVAGLGSILEAEWTASMLTGLLQALVDADYTLRTEVTARAWQMLQAAQQPDGSFTVEEGDDPVQTTLQAIAIAQRLTGRS